MQFDLDQISKLRDLISPEDEDHDSQQLPEQYQGSMLNPGTIGPQSQDKKQLAKPYTKVEAKVFGKEPEKPKKKKEVDEKKEIWKESEIKEIPISKNETRPRPEFEVKFKQKVGTEDIFLGMSEMDPTSTKCQELMMRVFMPETSLKEIQVDLTEQVACIQAPKYYLYHMLPYKINDKEAKAKWVSDKFYLELTLPIIREDPF